MSDMPDMSPEAVEKRMRMFFPGDYPETRYEKPTGLGEPMDPRLFLAEIIGFAIRMGRDIRNSPSDRIQAFDLARKAGLDQMNIIAAMEKHDGQ